MPTSGTDQKENFNEIIENTKNTCSSPDGKVHQVNAHNFDEQICIGSQFSFYVSGTENGKFTNAFWVFFLENGWSQEPKSNKIVYRNDNFYFLGPTKKIFGRTF